MSWIRYTFQHADYSTAYTMWIPIDVYLIDVYLIDVYLIDVYLIDVYLIDVYLIDVYLMMGILV